MLAFAHEKELDNFVTWVAGDHSYRENGVDVPGSGLIGAYHKIRALTKVVDPAASVKSDDVLNNAFMTNSKHTFVKPDWLKAEDKRFLILGQIVGDNVEVVNVTTTDLSKMKEIIRGRHGSLFPSDFDYLTGDPLLKMRDAIKNLIKFVGSGELIMWQDDQSTYLMPTYEQWIDDAFPGVLKTDRSQHHAIVIDIYPMKDKKTKEYFQFPEIMQVLGDIQTETDIFPVGYVTNQVEKISKFKGTPEFEWMNEDKTAFTFMGALWTSSDTKRSKPRTKEDDLKKRTRVNSTAPYGFQYIQASKYYENGDKKLGNLASDNIDFSNARREFRKWSDARTEGGLPAASEVVICVENGAIGVWFETVHDKTGKVIYNGNNELVRIGSTEVTQLKGQWRVPVSRMKRLWELVTGNWDLMIPEYLDQVRYFKEPNLSLDDALTVMDRTVTLPYGQMENLCSVHDHDGGLLNFQDPDDSEDLGVNMRLCIPLLLRCNSLWIYLYTETR